jgi:hypothetical protein
LALIALAGLSGCWALEDIAPLEPPRLDVGSEDDTGTEDIGADGESDGADCPVDQIFYRDADGDGFGVGGTTRCGALTPFTALADGDCDDFDENINPAALEICNGTDDNCDGVEDEGVQNACGGCGELPVMLGAACGGAGCEWTCMPSAPGPVCAVGGGDFVCGTCSTWAQGLPCGVCGRTTCAEGLDQVFIVCVDSGSNACGGCEPLPVQPGRPCGGGAAAYQCTGPNTVECSE